MSFKRINLKSQINWVTKHLINCDMCCSSNARQHTLLMQVCHCHDHYFDKYEKVNCSLCYWCYKTIKMYYTEVNDFDVDDIIERGYSFSLTKYETSQQFVSKSYVQKKIYKNMLSGYRLPNFINNHETLIKNQKLINNKCEKLNMIKFALNHHTLLFSYLPNDLHNTIITITNQLLS